jgi:hypothetical protein
LILAGEQAQAVYGFGCAVNEEAINQLRARCASQASAESDFNQCRFGPAGEESAARA